MRGTSHRGSFRFAGTALAVLLAGGCASSPHPPFAPPSAEETRRLKSSGYELPPVLDAKTLATPAQLQGPNHRIAKRVYSNDRLHVYTIESEAGTFYAWGDDVLDARIREIAAIQAMNEMRTTEEFATAANDARANSLVAEWNLISEPVDSAIGVPQEAWKRANAKGSDRAERRALKAFGHRKREIAAEFAVDPYSSNATLQRELNRLGWAVYAGGLPSMFVPAGVEATGEGDRMLEILRQYSPREIERLNRIELRVIGVPKPLTDEFIRNPWYSPRYATLLVADLAALSKARKRETFIEIAATARSESEQDARYFQRSAELMRQYDRNRGRIEEIIEVEGTLIGLTENGKRVVPYPADFAVWSESTAALTDSFTRAVPTDVPEMPTELLLAGSASPAAHRQLESRGVTVVEHAFHALRPAPGTSDAGIE
ncbi:MAG: hypothetical protein JRG80_16735 [Deltaproteobacteria bacterium]|nr:hypothetical protein [Deltaproteobacteria bacterium]